MQRDSASWRSAEAAGGLCYYRCMKIRLLWVVSGLWAAFFAYLASDSLRHAWAADGSIFNLGEKLQGFLAGVGAITIGALLPYGALRLHRFHKSRARHRLEKERDRIDRKLQRMDSKGGATEAV